MKIRYSVSLLTFVMVLAGCAKEPASTNKPDKVKPASTKVLDTHILMLDQNKDQKLSYEEWAGSSLAQFQQYLAPGTDEITQKSALNTLQNRRNAAKKALEAGPPDTPNSAKKRLWQQKKQKLEAEASVSDSMLEKTAASILTHYDFNHNGKIEKPEWTASLRQKFSAIDTNRDRSLSNDELLSYSKKIRQL